ncbi:MAG: Ca2+-dependent phosphoinositide-specific phospholipase C [Bacteroidia bacterium]
MQKQLTLFCFSLLLAACQNSEGDRTLQNEALQNQLKMNEIQFMASHNSYRIRTYEPLYEFTLALAAQLTLPEDPKAWDYTHLPIPQQLSDYNIRGLEIDIFNDPNGGHFYSREGMKFVNEPKESGIAELQQPGMKVLHIPDMDFMTHYYTFVSALQAVKTWSDAHPKHLPIVINVEAKESTIADHIALDGFIKAIPFDAVAWDALDTEVKSVFGENLEQVITPDEIRGNYPTLKEAILQKGWWTLEQARGKVIFALNISSARTQAYLNGHPSFEGRTMFAYMNDDASNAAAFIIQNDAKGDQAAITEYVKKGYMVRTRSDADTEEAKTGDYTPLNAALASGAQIISTDYYRPDERYLTNPEWTNFTATIPGNVVARSNPVLNTIFKGTVKE